MDIIAFLSSFYSTYRTIGGTQKRTKILSNLSDSILRGTVGVAAFILQTGRGKQKTTTLTPCPSV